MTASDRLHWGMRRSSPLVLAAAIALATLAFADQLRGDLPWWQWLCELGVAAALVVGLVPSAMAMPPEGRPRLIARWTAFGVSLGTLILGALRATEPGSELSAALLLIGAAIALLAARALPIDRDGLIRLSVGPASYLGSRTRRATSIAIALSGPVVAAAIFLNQRDGRLGLIGWLCGLGILAAGSWWSDHLAADSSPRTRPRLASAHVMAFLAVVTLACLLRFPLLADFPVTISADEGRLGGWAQKIWTGPRFPDLFALGWNSFPNLGYTVQYAMVPLLGSGIGPLRFSSAFVGMISVIATFFWVRRWWGVPTALLAMMLLAVAQEHIYWSRVGFNNIHAAAVAALVLAAFGRALQRGGRIDAVLLGYAAGLAFHTYHAAKLTPLFLIFAAAIVAASAPELARRYGTRMALAAFAFTLVVAPLTVGIAREWNRYHRDTSNRTDVGELVSAYREGATDLVRKHIDTHVGDSLRVFVHRPPLTIFDRWIGVAFALGVFWMLWNWRDPRNLVTLTFVLGLLLATMLTNFPPNRPRLVGLLPPAAAIAAVFVVQLALEIRRAWPRIGPRLVLAAVPIWLAGAVYQNLHIFFVQMPGMQIADVNSYLCRHLSTLNGPTVVYTAGANPSANPRNAMVDCMTAVPTGVRLVNLAIESDIVPLPATHRGNAVLLIMSPERELVPLVKQYYPSALEWHLQAPGADPELYVFSMREDEITRVRGLRPYPQPHNGEQRRDFERAPPAPNGLPLPVGVSWPSPIEWRGEIWVPATGRSTLRARGAELSVGWNATAALTEQTFGLATGWQPIVVRGTVTDPDRPPQVEAKWPDNSEWVLVNAHDLNRMTASGGLLAQYRTEPLPSRSGSFHQRIERLLDVDFNRFDDTEAPSWLVAGTAARWSGTVELSDPPLSLELDTNLPGKLWLDGKLLIDSSGGEPLRATVTASGDVPIAIEVISPANVDLERFRVRLLWQLPGGGWTALARYRPDAPEL